MKLKICGVKTIEEAEGLKNAGVDYAGLNFIPESPRCISLEAAQPVMAVLHGSSVRTVALFRDQPADVVNEYARLLNVDYVQLHGDETADYARSMQKPVIRAVAVDPAMSAAEIIDFIKAYPADYFVLDRHEQSGGDIVDTGIAKKVVDYMPDKVCLAGGLTPDNLAGILAKVRPYAIDISKGVRDREVIDIGKVKRCQRIMLQ